MIFLGLLFRKEDENVILEKSSSRVSNASNTFQWALINGLDRYKSLDIINVLPVGTYPRNYKELNLKTKKWKHSYNSNDTEIGSINLPVIKQLSRYRKVKKELHSRVDESKENIIIYSTYLPYLKAVSKLDSNVHVTLIVTDLPEYYDLAKVGILRRLSRKINNYFIYKYLTRIDSFVLLTEEMKHPLKVGKRPYILIEGIADLNEVGEAKELHKIEDRKIILYTGTLHYKYGIGSLLEGFRKIKRSNYELWICGSGEAAEDIIKLSKKDKRIKFFGFLLKKEVLNLQQQATVLVNPRPNEGEYTKYSFPSKTMEYLLSGKPVLMNRLDGIPKEYDDYLIYFETLNSQHIASKLIEVCEMSYEKRMKLGEKAKSFVIKNKTSAIQAKKIIKMIQ